jgi:hypothetical protein
MVAMKTLLKPFICRLFLLAKPALYYMPEVAAQ